MNIYTRETQKMSDVSVESNVHFGLWTNRILSRAVRKRGGHSHVHCYFLKHFFSIRRNVYFLGNPIKIYIFNLDYDVKVTNKISKSVSFHWLMSLLVWSERSLQNFFKCWWSKTEFSFQVICSFVISQNWKSVISSLNLNSRIFIVERIPLKENTSKSSKEKVIKIYWIL